MDWDRAHSASPIYGARLSTRVSTRYRIYDCEPTGKIRISPLQWNRLVFQDGDLQDTIRYIRMYLFIDDLEANLQIAASFYSFDFISLRLAERNIVTGGALRWEREEGGRRCSGGSMLDRNIVI